MAKTKTNTKTSSKLLSVKLSQIELPRFEEKNITGTPYVRWGKDNRWPNFLQGLADRSGLHNAIITTKLDYAFSEGLKPLTDSIDAVTKLFVSHPNPYESLNDLYKKLLYDYILYGTFAINIIWDKDREHIAELYHIDVSKIRCGKKDERGFIDTFYYSDNWMKSNSTNYKTIKAYNPKEKIGSQILFFTQYRPGVEYYALPDYTGALESISTDIEIVNFHLSQLKNGMRPSYMLTFTDGTPTEEEAQNLQSQIEDTFTGSDNAGKILLNFVNSSDKTPQVDALGADNLGEQFIQLEKSVLNQILSSHRVTSPLLVGIRGESSGLGSNSEEILEAFNLFYNTVIKQYQEPVVRKLNELIKFTKGYQNAVLEPTHTGPVDFTFSEATLLQILTRDELREKIGYETINEINENTDE